MAKCAIDCPYCNGLGLVRGKYAQKALVYECPKCQGWGWFWDFEVFDDPKLWEETCADAPKQ
jgi:hypothetical protein